MTRNDQDYQAGAPFADVLDGLERLAQRLDAQQFPGQAWELPSRRPAKRWVRQEVASLMAAAAVLAVAVYLGTKPLGIAPLGGAASDLARAAALADDQAVDELADSESEILFFEDLDSYSIIDLTGEVPLVSFATKDSYVPVCVVPLLPEPSS